MKVIFVIIIVTAFYATFSIIVGKTLNRLASETEKRDEFYPKTKAEKITFKMRLRRLHKISNRK